MGSIPSLVTMGKKMGVKISTAGVMSIKIPTNNNKTLMINKMTILLSLIPNRAELISCGMFSYDITHDMLMEAPMSSMTIAVVADESSNTSAKIYLYISIIF